MVNKITVVGAGNVGATTAQRVAEKELARTVVMVDVAEGIPQGKGLDQWQSAPVEGYDSRIIGSNGYDESKDSDIVIITAGIARKPGMSRDDLLNTNAGIVKSVAEQVKATSPKAIIIVVSNPLDVMCYVAMKASGFPGERVIGMAGVLDTARYRTFLAEAIDVSVKDIQAMVLGGHGDTMVPLISYTSVSGIPITQLLAKDKLDAIVDRARNGGAEIVKYLKTGSAYYAPSSGAVQMAEAIVRDQKRILPCAAWLQGEYGMKDLFLGVPVKLGRKGMEKVIEVELTKDERAALEKSAEAVREPMRAIKIESAVLDFYRSTIGKKIIMAVTGLIWVGFVILHMAGNLQAFLGAEKLNNYAAILHGPLEEVVWLQRVLLFVALVLHVLMAYQLTRRAAAARPVGYKTRAPQVSTMSSRTMRIGGILLLVFIVLHVLHFTTHDIDPTNHSPN